MNLTTQATASGAAGASVYSPFTLSLYDILVLGLTNSFIWSCPTRTVQLPFFKAFIGRRHLDIGPGTGYYLANGNIPKDTQVSLMDLNPSSLEFAKQRLGRPDVQTVQADITQPIQSTQLYDSISIFFVIHCLPGPAESKMQLFTNLKPLLAENGTIYGTTVLGKDIRHNWLGRILIRGIFDNRGDGEMEIREALTKNYETVETRIVGRVLMFSASQPKL
ncbi:unnamed protein product [Penicillium bialowiezense]